MLVHRIINAYRFSNTFIIESGKDRVVLVDVGGPEIEKLTAWLSENNKDVEGLLLTHEHADHCLGVNALYKIYKFPIFCSKSCSKNISNSKQNFSFYVDEIPTFEINLPSNTLEDQCDVNIGILSFSCFETPGHSPGGMCYLIDNSLFTGDTILNNAKTPLTFPHSDRIQYASSIKRISTVIKPGMTIYPGHGDPFQVKDSKTVTSVKR